jgi:hypothetical protein
LLPWADQALTVHLAALQAVHLLAAAAAALQITKMDLTAGLAAAPLKIVTLALLVRVFLGKVLRGAQLPVVL